MDRDGTSDGYDLPLTSTVARAVGVPVIASGGAGTLDHLVDALNAGADAVLCASIFHYGTYTIAQAKAAPGGRGHPGAPAAAAALARRLRRRRAAGRAWAA